MDWDWLAWGVALGFLGRWLEWKGYYIGRHR